MGAHYRNRRPLPETSEGVLMRGLRRWVNRMKFLFGRDRHEQELAEEIQANIALHIDDNLGRGMPPDEARRKALVRFGSIDNAKEAVRAARGIAFAQSVIQDM